MKTEQDYTRDVTEIRSMMERSTKFLSLTGWSGIMAGIYALAGAYFANKFIYNNDVPVNYDKINLLDLSGVALDLFLLAVSILVLAIGTALFLSYRKTKKSNERLWNPSARRLVISMAVPLVTGGIFIVLLLSKGMFQLIVPSTLMFYGLSLSSASNFTYDEIKYLGIIEIVLGLIALCFIGDGLLFWSIGFGIMHIIFGIYLHLRYDK
jgi:membrane-associated HD superfamily phosphohydrolase